jgi:ribulose-phosphate 3-epimerase
MIVEPEKHIGAFVQAGADRITVHVETCPHLHRVVQQIREAGARPAVALNPHTPAVMVEEILPFVDMVLVMTVNPGFGGQQFIPETLRKIEQLHTAIVQRGLAVDIQVDGGIDLLTAPQVVAKGASVLVAGTFVFGAPEGVAAAIASLRAAASQVRVNI